MRDILKPIEKIGINRCIQVNERSCVVIAVNDDSSIVKYADGGTEVIKLGTMINPLEAPLILISWY